MVSTQILHQLCDNNFKSQLPVIMHQQMTSPQKASPGETAPLVSVLSANSPLGMSTELVSSSILNGNLL